MHRLKNSGPCAERRDGSIAIVAVSMAASTLRMFAERFCREQHIELLSGPHLVASRRYST